VTVLDSRELVSKISLVTLGASAQPILRALHTVSHAKEPLALDDEMEGAHVWMFGAPIAKTKVRTTLGDYALRIEFLGLEGTANMQRLGDVVRPAHLVVLVLTGDEEPETVAATAQSIRAQMRAERSEQLAVWIEHDRGRSYGLPVLGSGKGGASSLLSAIVQTIRSGKSPGPL
jgi:hypothetical protein